MTTLKHLQMRLDQLNKLLGRPTETWKTVDGRTVANVGCFHLDSAYGGYYIGEICNEGGGVHVPFGYRRMSKGELCYHLDAILAAVEIAKGQS